MAAKFITTVKRLLALWKLYAKMDIGWFMRDNKFCLLNILADVVSNITAISGVFLLSERFDGIGGMDRTQILFMLGYAVIIDGIFLLFLGMGNVGFISRRAGRGQIDHMIIQPLPFWMQLASEGFVPASGSGTLICGIGISLYAIAQLKIVVTPLWTGFFLINVLSSVIITLAISYIMGAMAFYAPVATEEASTTAIELIDRLKSYPLGGMPQIAKILLCTVLPVGLATWFPANVLLHQTPAGFPSLLTVFAALFFMTIASIFFKKGMKDYAKYGSTRYLDRGHRR